MNPNDIRPGLILRVINPHGLGAPLKALATVETVGTSPPGDWLCTVRYHDKRQTKRGRLYRSHLWAGDVGRFEIVTDEQDRQSTVLIRRRGRKNRVYRSTMS